jgi:FAD/FMN-containing dehydrogenase
MVRTMTYPEMYMPDDESYHPMAVNRTGFADTIEVGEAEAIVARLEASTASMAVAQLRVLGGEMARVPADATAFAHRARRIMVTVASLYERPDQREESEGWASDLSSALFQGEPAAYVNFLGDEGEERIHQAYPRSTWDRLADIKSRYDPTNLFRLNQNIPPTDA